jgi:hypothetical protein
VFYAVSGVLLLGIIITLAKQFKFYSRLSKLCSKANKNINKKELDETRGVAAEDAFGENENSKIEPKELDTARNLETERYLIEEIEPKTTEDRKEQLMLPDNPNKATKD